MTKDTIFLLASMTKPITAIAVMQLVDEGRLSLAEVIKKARLRPADRELNIYDF